MKFFKWLFSWKTLRRLLLTVAVLVTLGAVYARVDTWRAAREWQRYRQAQEAKGVVLDWRKFAPPPVPEDRNFAMTPLWKELGFVRPTPHPRVADIRPDRGDNAPELGEVYRNGLVDLAAWQKFYAGNTNYPQASGTGVSPVSSATSTLGQDAQATHVILTALGKFDADLAELETAARERPETRFPIAWDTEMPFEILLPHLSPVRNVGRVLQLRAVARLATGQSEPALADAQLMFRLADTIKPEPFLVSHLVRVAVLSSAVEVLQEGLARQAWNDAQLTEWDRQLAALDLLPQVMVSLCAERAANVGAMECLQKRAPAWTRFTPMPWAMIPAMNLVKVLAAGDAAVSHEFPWRMLLFTCGDLDRNKIHMCDWTDRYALAAVNAKQRRFQPGLAVQVDRELAAHAGDPAAVFAQLTLPNHEILLVRSASAQTLLDEARIAVALERYRLARGSYPDALAAIVPAYLPALPRDLVTGGPLVYRREGDTGYVLYALGWNGKDDGGTVVMNNQKPPKVDPAKGDWVWRWPAR